MLDLAYTIGGVLLTAAVFFGASQSIYWFTVAVREGEWNS